jgi:hypothetical protein
LIIVRTSLRNLARPVRVALKIARQIAPSRSSVAAQYIEEHRSPRVHFPVATTIAVMVSVRSVVLPTQFSGCRGLAGSGRRGGTG